MTIERISIDSLRPLPVMERLSRPESVLCTQAGDLFVSHRNAGAAWIRPDGSLSVIGGVRSGGGADFLPNGIAMRRDGVLLLANIGEEGGVWRLARDGTLRPFLAELDGAQLPPANFVMVDPLDRVWISFSTRQVPRHLSYRRDVADGFIVLVDTKGARIVADGLHYTNEVRLDDSGDRLYVNETFGQRVTRFRVAPDGSLSDREIFTQFPPGSYVDGMEFDSEKGLWVTCIVSNRLYRVERDGSFQLVIEDSDPAFLLETESALDAGAMGRRHFDTVTGKVLRNISSIAFGGSDLRTAYLGCLLGDALLTFRSPVPGRKPVHWHVSW